MFRKAQYFPYCSEAKLKYGSIVCRRMKRQIISRSAQRCSDAISRMKWVLLWQFQDRRQQQNESVEDYFQSMHQKGKHLNKAPLDIMETIVASLLPPVSKFVMLRSPQTLEQALDLALTASVLQQDSTTDKVESALATITDKIGALQTNLNSIQSQTPF